eukprot:scaffold53536_cov58-Phaeocystis_antarctica.AAC.2
MAAKASGVAASGCAIVDAALRKSAGTMILLRETRRSESLVAGAEMSTIISTLSVSIPPTAPELICSASVA